MASMVKQMHSLTVTDLEYAVLYYQCMQQFPTAARELPKPVFGSAAATVAFQQQPTPVQGTVNPVAGPTFVPPVRKPDGCAFCANYGHRIRDCPSALDYVTHGLAVLHDGRIKLPNYTPVLNDGTGRGIKYSIDKWLATQNPSVTPVAPATTAHSTVQSIPLCRDDPPHRVVPRPAEGVTHPEVIHTNMVLQVDEPTSSPPTDDEFTGLFEVFSSERRHKTTTMTTAAPTLSAGSAPQYSYHSDAEDPTLIAELAALL